MRIINQSVVIFDNEEELDFHITRLDKILFEHNIYLVKLQPHKYRIWKIDLANGENKMKNVKEALEKYKEFIKLRDELSDLDRTGEYIDKLDKLTIDEWR